MIDDTNNSATRILNQLDTLKKIIDNTIYTILTRGESHPDYGWIDLKIDAITGENQFSSNGVKNSSHIYSWIQGRGLEALSLHALWYKKFNGIATPLIEKITAVAQRVASLLDQEKSEHKGHLYFLMDQFPQDNTHFTMSDLFVSRGLFACSTLLDSNRENKEAVQYLLDTIEAVVEGSFYNDQISFDNHLLPSNDNVSYSYAPHMLALGGVNLLMKYEHSEKGPILAKNLINYIIKNHMSRMSHLPDGILVESLDQKMNPFVDKENHIVLDPGHALECVGLISEVLISYRSEYDISTDEDEWISSIESLLPTIFKANFDIGFIKGIGFYKNIDAISLTPIKAYAPWWSIPEAMRALSLLQKIGGKESWSEETFSTFSQLLSIFVTRYVDPSQILIALQTIDPSGAPIPVIPATPDLDPGYHTGLSFIACYDALALQLPIMYKHIEVDITPTQKTYISGHVARRGLYTEIIDSLHGRIAYFRTAYVTCILVNCDVLEFSQQVALHIKEKLSHVFNIEIRNILLSATHTHTAPPIITLGSLQEDKEYILFLSNKMNEGAKLLSQKSTFPITTKSFSFTSSIGINRRWWDEIEKKTIMKPNPCGSYDNEIHVVALLDCTDSIVSLFVNTAVHPTTLGVSIKGISADYPGRIQSHLQLYYGKEVVVIPFTGSCGDVRPNIVDSTGSSFREGLVEDIDNIGKTIAVSIIKRIQKGFIKGKEQNNSITLSHISVTLPFSSVPTREELTSFLHKTQKVLEVAKEKEKSLDSFSKSHNNPLWAVEIEKEWATSLLEEKEKESSIDANLSILSLGDQCILITIPGELFSSVGKKIKETFPHKKLLIACYSGGSVGYIPSKESFKEGGYEVDEAFKFYHHPGPFKETVESILLDKIASLMRENALQS